MLQMKEKNTFRLIGHLELNGIQ